MKANNDKTENLYKTLSRIYKIQNIANTLKMKTNKPEKQYSELMTYSEYAKHKKISLKTVYNYVNTGLIKPLIIGKAKFIKLIDTNDTPI